MPPDDQPARFVLAKTTLPGFEGYPYWIPAEDEVAPDTSGNASDPWAAFPDTPLPPASAKGSSPLTVFSGNQPVLANTSDPWAVFPDWPPAQAQLGDINPFAGLPNTPWSFPTSPAPNNAPWSANEMPPMGALYAAPSLFGQAAPLPAGGDPWAAFPDWPSAQAPVSVDADLLAAYPDLHARFFASQAPGNAAWSVTDLPPTGSLFSAPKSFGAPPQASSDPWAAFPDWPSTGTSAAANLDASVGNDPNNRLNLPASTAAASVAGGISRGTNAPYGPLQTGLDALSYAFQHSADPELADAENVRDLVENYRKVAKISGGVGLATALGIPLAFYLSASLKGALARGAAAKPLTRAEQLAKNRADGKAYEDTTASNLKRSELEFAPQVTVETRSGIQMRVDFVTREPLTGELGCIECKASSTARLTPNQILAIREIGRSGGTIVGAGKPGFPGGTRIPPTKVQILRGP
jgi:hypothetical protein